MSHNESEVLVGSKIRIDLAGPEYVDLWIAEYDPTVLQRCPNSLSREELSRCRLFMQPADGERFLIRRTALRTILASYLAISPADVEYCYNENGAPSLAKRPNHPRRISAHQDQPNSICFSTSSSGDCWCVAVASGSSIGVDIEFCREGFVTDELAATFMSRGELERWRSLSHVDRDQAFWRLWTAKEAILKGTGRGLSISPHIVELDLFAQYNDTSTSVQVSLADTQWEVYQAFIPAEATLSIGAIAECLSHNPRTYQRNIPSAGDKSLSLAIALSK